MDRSQTLYKLQELDSILDNSLQRITEINAILEDKQQIVQAEKQCQALQSIADEKNKILRQAENQVSDQNFKIEQNQTKLYGGAITNPKELEDLQQESVSLNKYLQILEERQLEAMIAAEQAQNDLEKAHANLSEIKTLLAAEHSKLRDEKADLEQTITLTSEKRERFLSKTDLPDLPTYNALRDSSAGIAVTLMTSGSCSSCGASIPSAIEQSAHSPGKLAFCPTCKRILHPG